MKSLVENGKNHFKIRTKSFRTHETYKIFILGDMINPNTSILFLSK